MSYIIYVILGIHNSIGRFDTSVRIVSGNCCIRGELSVRVILGIGIYFFGLKHTN